MDGISRSRGWDKEIPHCVLLMEQLVLSDKWARKLYPHTNSLTDSSVSIALYRKMQNFGATLKFDSYLLCSMG